MNLRSFALLSTLLASTPATASGPGAFGARMEASARAIVSAVEPGGAAAAAGVRVGDLLLAVDGVATPTREAFSRALQACSAGDRLMIRLRRADCERYALVELGPSTAGVGGASLGRGYLGLRARPAGRGLAVLEVVAGGPAARAGLTRGDLVVRVGGRRTASIERLDAALVACGAGRPVRVEFLRGARLIVADVPLGSRPSDVTLARWRADQIRAEVRALRDELRVLRGHLERRRGRRE
ncbi:MAG: PDZ domain-containing protein [Planctomycetota bacterium]|nr:PDZ domain-containing protein [Planctomycetota bacterium]